MVKRVKVSEAKTIYDMLNALKLNGVDTQDKFKIIGACRVLKPLAKELEEASSDAVEKLRPEGYEEKFQKAVAYERTMDANRNAAEEDQKELPITREEYDEIVALVVKFNNEAQEAVKKVADTVKEVDIDLLDNDGFGKLLEANADLTTANAVTLADFIC